MTALALLWLVGLVGAAATAAGAWPKSMRPTCAILAFTVLALITRIAWDGAVWHGLEYEDAYVYAVAAKQAAESGGIGDGPLRVCVVGAPLTCDDWETYPGHLAGFPALISAAARVTGFSPELAPTISAVLSASGALFVFLAASALWGLRPAVLAALCYAVTPAFATFGSGANAEGVSAFLVAVTLAALLTLRDQTGRTRTIAAATCVLTILLAISVKRENLVLLAALPLAASHQPLVTTRRWLLGIIALTLLAAVVLPGPARSIIAGLSEYDTFPFTPSLFLQGAPSMGVALVSARWFLLLAPLLAVGAYAIVRLRGPSLWLLITAGLYLTLYASHIRSYYQLQHGDLEPFDWLRYLANVSAPLALVAGAGADRLLRLFDQIRARAVSRLLIVGLAVPYAVVGVTLAQDLREELVEAETRVRVQPALAALDAWQREGQRGYVLTAEPLLVQLYGPPTINVVDVHAVSPALLDELRSREVPVWYLEQAIYQSPENRERYAQEWSLIESVPWTPVTESADFRLFRLIN